MVDSRQTIFLAWEENHAACFEQHDACRGAHYFPVNQKAAAAWLALGKSLSLSPFWELYRQIDLELADRAADRYAAAWHGELHLEVNSARAWLWAREAAFLRQLLATLEHRCGVPSYLVPRAKFFRPTNWHNANCAALAVMESHAVDGASIKWLDLPEMPTHSTPIPSSPLIAPAEKWLLFSAFAIPDLAHHLARLLFEGSWSIRLLLDPRDPLPAGVVAALQTAAGRRLQLCWLDLQLQATSPLAPPVIGDRLGEWILATSHDPASMERQLTSLVAQDGFSGCVVSDHHSAQTLILRRLCAAMSAPLCVVPHSSWPMDTPFALGGTSSPHEIHLASTRRAAEHIAAHTPVPLAAHPLPSPRYRPKMVRFLRRLRRWLALSAKPLQIGAIITSGEEISAPDMALIDIVDSLRILCQTLGHTPRAVELHVRLRAAEDRQEVLATLLDTQALSVFWEKSTQRTPFQFLQDVDLVVEIGTPGSATLECFAQPVPVLRLGPVDQRHRAQLLPATLVPCLSADATGSEILQTYLARRWLRLTLALRQWLYLVTQTLPESHLPVLLSTRTSQRKFPQGVR